jgi:cysteine desulfurase
MILNGITQSQQNRRRIVIGAGEHKSILEPCHWLQEIGFVVEQIPLTRLGVVSVSEAERLITDETLLVSVQGANNETGVLQPVKAIADLARLRGAFMHCDATQMPGKVSIALDDMGVDYASVSAHKVYGPKGVGACYIRGGSPRAALTPLLRGGGQESELRAGTLNVPGIVGFGKACQLLTSALDHDSERVRSLRDHFEMRINDLCPDSTVIGKLTKRLAGTSCIILAEVPSDILLARVNDLCISSGSACTSGSVSPSHVILSCGYSREDARSTIRVSFGRYSTIEEAEYAAVRLTDCAKAIRDDLARLPKRIAATKQEQRDDAGGVS